MGYYSNCRQIILNCNYHNPSEVDYQKFLSINDKVLADIIIRVDKEDNGEYLIKNYSSMWYNSHYKTLNKYDLDQKALLKIFNAIKNFKKDYFNANTGFIKNLKEIAFDKFNVNLFDNNDFNKNAINWYFNNTRWDSTFDYKVLLTPHGRYLIDNMIENNIHYLIDSRFLEKSEYEINDLKLSEEDANIIREYTQKIRNYCQYKHYRSIYMYSYKEDVEKQINELRDVDLKHLLSVELEITDDITEDMKVNLKNSLMEYYRKDPEKYIHYEQVFMDYRDNL